jgi:ubiquinone/menaquinone biosynthesis C-methylase UbiE
MFDHNFIIYGGGKLGLHLTLCLRENGKSPLFVWDKNASGDLPIKDFADVRIPEFTAKSKYSDCLVVVCLADSQVRAEVVSNLHSIGFEKIKEFSSISEINAQFSKEVHLRARKKTAWMIKGTAKIYDESTRDDNLWSEAVIFPLYTRYLASDSRILDVGTGTGRLAIYLFKKGFNVTGIDISREQLSCLHKKESEIDFRIGDAKNLPFENDFFDAITSQWFLQHFDNWKEYLAEQVRVCKPSGIIVFEFSFREHYLYAQAALGLSNIECSYGNYIDIDSIEMYDPSNGIDYLSTTTYKELSEFCFNNNCAIEAIMPHSLFVTNAFVEGVLGKDEILCLKPYRTERDIDAISVLTFYENNYVSKLPYWFTRRCIIALRKK